MTETRTTSISLFMGALVSIALFACGGARGQKAAEPTPEPDPSPRTEPLPAPQPAPQPTEEGVMAEPTDKEPEPAIGETVAGSFTGVGVDELVGLALVPEGRVQTAAAADASPPRECRLELVLLDAYGRPRKTYVLDEAAPSSSCEREGEWSLADAVPLGSTGRFAIALHRRFKVGASAAADAEELKIVELDRDRVKPLWQKAGAHVELLSSSESGLKVATEEDSSVAAPLGEPHQLTLVYRDGQFAE